MILAYALELSGYVPNAEQSESVRQTLRLLISLFPMACYALAALLFARFGLDRAEHARIRARLDGRAPEGA